MLKGLYGITDSILTPQTTLLDQVESALKGGMRILQLRDKREQPLSLLPQASALMELCAGYGALFVINDHLELACALKAPALHIGEHDGALQEARKRLPDAIIGVSCYGDVVRARAMQELGADYVAFGSFFPSPTKPASALVPLLVLEEARAILKIPVCAIGGITLQNAPVLIEKGAHMVAVVSDLWRSQTIEAHALAFSTLF